MALAAASTTPPPPNDRLRWTERLWGAAQHDPNLPPTTKAVARWIAWRMDAMKADHFRISQKQIAEGMERQMGRLMKRPEVKRHLERLEGDAARGWRTPPRRHPVRCYLAKVMQGGGSVLGGDGRATVYLLGRDAVGDGLDDSKQGLSESRHLPVDGESVGPTLGESVFTAARSVRLRTLGESPGRTDESVLPETEGAGRPPTPPSRATRTPARDHAHTHEGPSGGFSPHGSAVPAPATRPSPPGHPELTAPAGGAPQASAPPVPAHRGPDAPPDAGKGGEAPAGEPGAAPTAPATQEQSLAAIFASGHDLLDGRVAERRTVEQQRREAHRREVEERLARSAALAASRRAAHRAHYPDGCTHPGCSWCRS